MGGSGATDRDKHFVAPAVSPPLSWRGYSWAGICCSISRQALILRRRQTQQRGSLATVEVSAPQTEQIAGFFRRSGENARFACSRISGGTTISGFPSVFRLI